MKSIIEKISGLLPEQRNRHSFFQIKHFIIGKEPTIQGRLHACLRELEERKKTLEAIENEIAEEFDNTLLLREQAKRYEKKNGTVAQIKLRKVRRRTEATEKRIQTLRDKMVAIEQEAMFLIETYEWLLTQEELKEWDDFQVQGDYWNAKLLNELRTSLFFTRHLSSDLINTIMAMPASAPVRRQLIGLQQQTKALASQNVERLEAKQDT